MTEEADMHYRIRQDTDSGRSIISAPAIRTWSGRAVAGYSSTSGTPVRSPLPALPPQTYAQQVFQ
jgi:hypothetical protein